MTELSKPSSGRNRSAIVMRWLTPVWVVLSLAAIGWQVALHWTDIFDEPLRFDLLSISFVATISAKLFSAVQVRRSLLQSGADIGEQACFYAYSMADLAKYLPGGIWGFVGRIALYRRLRVDAVTITRAVILEQIWLVGGAVTIGLVFLSTVDIDTPLRIAAIAAAAGWVVFLFLSRRIATARNGRFAGLAWLVSTQAALWLLAGIGFGVLLPSEFMRGSGAFCLAFAAGLMAPFAPSGIGVREAVVASFVTPTLPAGDVLRALILSRAMWIAADATFAIAVVVLCRPAWVKAVLKRQAKESA